MTEKGITITGAFVNISLSMAKIGSGILFNSQAILADGIHSLSDLFTDLITYGSIVISEKPADKSHHYGHFRLATIFALFLGITIIASAIYIAYEAVSSTINKEGKHIEPLIPLIIAVISILSKEVLYKATIRIAEKTKNLALKANAWHHRSDAFTSIATACGLIAIEINPRLFFVDAVVAIALCILLFVIGLKITYNCFSELADRAPEKETIESIKKIVKETEGIKGFHALRARMLAGKIAMDIHVQVDPNITVKEAHDIAAKLREKILKSKLNVIDVVVHIDPHEK